MIKQNKLSISQQVAALKRDYGFGTTKMIGPNKLKWDGELKSSPIGDAYLIKIIYELHSSPQVFVVKPEKLSLPEGEVRLKHVYSHEKQKLCLYYPKAKEWSGSQYLTNTILPWTIEWLYHYEIWLITGEWLGGGIVHNSEKK